MDDINISVSLRETMDYLGIKVKHLAEVDCCYPDTITKFRTGKRSPSIARFSQLLYSMELLHPGSLVYFCNHLSGRVDANLIEEIVASIDVEEIVEYVPTSQLSELSEAVNSRLRGIPTLRYNYIDMADRRDLKMLCRSLIKRLIKAQKLSSILDVLEDEGELAEISVAIAQRMARQHKKQREDLRLAGLIDEDSDF